MTDAKTTPRRSRILLGEQHTTVFNRLAAKSIDVLVVVAVYFLGQALWHPLGVIGASLFGAMQDGWGVGQSIGKRIIGMRVIDDASGLSCSFRNSFLRNFPLALSIVFAAVPVLWALFLIVSVPLICFEGYLLLTLDTGVRLGDVLGNTLVVEYLDGFD